MSSTQKQMARPRGKFKFSLKVGLFVYHATYLACVSNVWSLFRYIFLEYSSPSHAHEAVKNADAYKLDKQHTFRVNLFTDFDKYVQLN